MLTWSIQAHRIIFTIVFTGARAVARSVAESWKQASANSQYAKKAAQAEGTGASNTLSSAGLTLDEACKILNVSPPKAGKMDTETMVARFKKLYDNNEPKNGGSFYLQSKVLRARERIELELRKTEEEETIREGSKTWNH